MGWKRRPSSSSATGADAHRHRPDSGTEAKIPSQKIAGNILARHRYSKWSVNVKGEENSMRLLKAVCVIILALSSAATAFAAASRPTKLVVRVFQIPREQSFEVLLPTGKNQTVSLQSCGDVTANFPRATVLIPTELSLAASEDAIGEIIFDKIAFGSGLIVARHIRIEEIKSLNLEIGGEKPGAEARFERKEGERRTSDYEIRAESVSADKNGTIIRLRFDAGWSAQAGRLGVGMMGGVIDQPILVPASKLLLIGAPWQGAVYWLAICSSPAAD
jgi:hypothetical protein